MESVQILEAEYCADHIHNNIYHIADMAKKVAEDDAEVSSITNRVQKFMSLSPPLVILNVRRGITDSRQWYESGIMVPALLPHLNEVPEVIVSSGVTPVGLTKGPMRANLPPNAWMSPDNARFTLLIFVML